PDSVFKIVVTHHQFIPPPGEAAKDLIGGAKIALEVIETCGIDLLLAGHLHRGYTGDVRVYYPATKRSIIVAQAGTAISTRTRTESNSYNLITIDHKQILIAVRLWNGSSFVESLKSSYTKTDGQW